MKEMDFLMKIKIEKKNLYLLQLKNKMMILFIIFVGVF